MKFTSAVAAIGMVLFAHTVTADVRGVPSGFKSSLAADPASGKSAPGDGVHAKEAAQDEIYPPRRIQL
jgi:hypothetical protein